MRSKNSQDTIGQALAALFSQEYRDFELLVVDSGSTDGTLETVAKFPCRLIQIEAKSYFPGHVLNRAIEETSSELIVMQNSDTVPLTPHALTHLLAPFEDSNVVATFSRQLPRPDAVPWVRRDYARSFVQEGPAPPWLTLSFPLAALRRKTWEEHPFYTDAWASEDTEWGHWARTRGYETRYVPEAIVMHSHNYTLRQIYGRRFVEGEADAFIYGGTDKVSSALWKMATTTVRDVLLHAGIGALREMLAMPARRGVYYWAYHKGHLLGEQRIARGDADTSKGQTTILERHDAK
jgi:rhamnosyltransferase